MRAFEKAKGTTMRKAVACALALALVVQGLPAVALAESGDQPFAAVPSSRGQSLNTQGTAPVDLNAAWSAQEGGTDAVFAITEGGTYRLSADLTVSMPVTVDAAGQEVVIDLADHELAVVSNGGAGHAVYASAASKVSIVGDSPDKARLVLNSSPITYAIHSDADALSVSGISVDSTLNDTSLTLASLQAADVYASTGSISVDDCRLAVDISNQRSGSANKAAQSGVPANVCLAADVSGARVTNVQGTVKGSPSVAVDSSSLEDSGWAYGVFSKSLNPVVVSGCAFDVSSPLGNACGVCGPNIVLDRSAGDETLFSVEGAQHAIGVYGTNAASATVDARIEVAYGAFGSDHEVALLGGVGNAFTFGSSFDGDALAVQIGADDAANDAGTRIGTFVSSVTASQRTSALRTLVNALGSTPPCSVSLDDDGLYFALASVRAPVELGRQGTVTPYASFAAAVRAAQSGDVIRLRSDLGDLSFTPPSSKGASYTIDLAGCSITSFTTDTVADVMLVSSSAGGVIEGVNDTSSAAVTYSGTGSLHVKDVAVRAVSSAGKAYGVYSTGKGSVELEGVDLLASSASGEVRGIYQRGSTCGDLTLRGGSLKAQTHTVGGVVYGVCSTATSNTVTISSCPVSVSGTTGLSVGIDFMSKLALAGTAGTTTVSVATTGAASTAVGARAMRARATATLDACSLSVQPGSALPDVDYWCLTSAGNSATFSLDGACGFESASGSHVYVTGNPLQLGSSFSLAGASTVNARVDGLDSVAFADVGQGASAAALAARFAAAAGDSHEGWTASANTSDGVAHLEWTREDVVRNDTAGMRYCSLADALAAAVDGDELILLDDDTVNGTLVASNTVTLDLSGHELVVNAGAQAAAGASGTGAAVSFTGAGISRITDSSGGRGLLDVRVGSPAETAAGVYQGIFVGNGSLDLDGCAVSVSYRGRSSLSSPPAATVRGITVQGESVSLAGAARLDVSSAAESGSFGASDVEGVYLADSAAGATVAKTASVSVSNESATLAQSNTNTANLVALNVDALRDCMVDDAGTMLYDQIQEAFYAKSKFDGNNDSGGLEYGARVYYLSDYELPCGITVWAYSDQVSAEAAGTRDAIVAAHVFVDLTPRVAQAAYGIVSAQEFAGTVVQAGKVSASCVGGNAFALNLPDSTMGETDDANLTATCGTEPYAGLVGQLDLADYIEFEESFDGPITYLNQNNPKIGSISCFYPCARAKVPLGNDPRSTMADSAGILQEAYPETPSTVALTFTNLHGADGLLADRQATVSYGTTMAETGKTAGSQQLSYSDFTPADYAAEGVTYRFAGWRPLGSPTVLDWRTVYNDLPVDSLFDGADDGAVTLCAEYVPLMPGQHLVSFVNEYEVNAYAVDDGARPSYASSASGNLSIPSRPTTRSGYSLSHMGWAPGYVADDTWTEQATCYAGALPAVRADVTYTALYKAIPSLMTLAFVYMQESAAGYVYAASYERYFDWTERSAIDAANARVMPGDTYEDEGSTYRFMGWSTRMSDVEPMYTDQIQLSYGDSTFSGSVAYYGIYEQEARTVTVNFYVNGELYATAADAPVTKTVNAAFAASSNPAKPVSEGMAFRGWNTSADASTYLYGNIKTVGSVAGTSDVLNLHAIWRDASAVESATVTFYDDDRKTKLLSIDVNLGQTVVQAYDEAYEPPAAEGKVFVKWVDADGATFSTSTTPVEGDIALYARYRTESSSTGKLGDATGVTTKPSGDGGGTGANTPASSQPSASLPDVGAAATGAGSAGTLAGVTGAAAVKSASSSGATARATGEASGGTVASEEGVSMASEVARDEALSEAGAIDGGASSFDGNAAGFVAFQVVAIALLGALVWWLFSRRRAGADEERAAVDAPEVEAIRF